MHKFLRTSIIKCGTDHSRLQAYVSISFDSLRFFFANDISQLRCVDTVKPWSALYVVPFVLCLNVIVYPVLDHNYFNVHDCM